MQAGEKLESIRNKKKLLQDKLSQIEKASATAPRGDEQELSQLMQQVRIKLEQQLKKKQQYKKLEDEYLKRKEQAEKERQLEKIKNQKRMLELEVAMKKVVFEGIKEKVKGMNSEQLHLRGFLAGQSAPGLKSALPSSSASGFKQAFESYLVSDPIQKIQPIYELGKLNEQRLEIFQKKEQVIMRKILIRQLSASEDTIQIDVLGLNREQLIDELEKRGIDLDDYMHPVRKEDIVEHYDSIKEQAKTRIQQQRRQAQRQKQQIQEAQKNRKMLRQQVNQLPYKSIEVVKRLLYDLFDSICDDYQKRHVNRSKQDQQQISKKLQEEYDELWRRNLVDQLSYSLLQSMLAAAKIEMIKEAAQETATLNQFAHQKTQACFKSFLGEGDIAKRLKQITGQKITLNFVRQNQNGVSKPKNDNYLKKKLEGNQNNVFQTQQNTVNLVNDINLLTEEERYFKNVKFTTQNEFQFKDEAIFYYDKRLHAITQSSISLSQNKYVLYSFVQPIQNLLSAFKINRSWLLRTNSAIHLITPWNKQEWRSALGGRISNPCGDFTTSAFYPTLTLMGSPCSAILGFEKGQIMKFNFNQNRLTSKQTNLTQYHPVFEHAKTNDQPPFPLDNRNYIQIQQEKPKPTDQIHEYRQFFEHHSEPIIFAGFYRVDRMISVDRNLKCALWQYGRHKGASSFEPIFKFEIKSSYLIYRQDENPRYRDIFPTNSSTESPQDLYQKYMQNQSFLKQQLYNNPKKQIAYFKSPQWDKQEGDKPIWKVTYKDNRKQINKIIESYYDVLDGTVIAEQVKLHNDSLYILCERQHNIRNDLKTIKIYGWSITQKKLARVGLEMDMYKDQKVSNFAILGTYLKGLQMQIAMVVNSGRVLLFSLVSGQLLKSINEQVSSLSKDKPRYYFKTIIEAPDRQIIYGISSNSVLQLHFDDSNTINEKNKVNKAIDNVKRKFFR